MPLGGASDLERARQEWSALAPLLAGKARVRIGVSTSRDGRPAGLAYRDRDEWPLTKVLPSRPAAVRVYGDDGCCVALCLDLDAARGDVAADSARIAQWLTRHGARYLTDVSPSGGVHIYVPVAGRIPFEDARDIVEALATTHPTLDAGPHRSIKTGCIRVPGSAHKSGGHQQLTTALGVAYDTLRRPNPAAVLEALRADLAPQIAARRAARTATNTATTWDDRASVAGPRRSLPAWLRRIAETGEYDRARYPSPSEARQAVITAAVRQGWALVEVASRVNDGRWPGLASMYARYRPGTRHRALGRDWHNAHAHVTAADRRENPDHAGSNSHVRKSHTSRPESHRGAPSSTVARAEHDHIRTWRTLLRATELHRFPGRRGHLARFVLRALGEAAHKTADRRVAFGTRSLAVAVGADHSTVAAVLRRLSDEPGGWIDLVDPARGESADLYELTIPTDLVAMAGQLRWDKGRAHALRPVFRALGHVTALVYEAIEADRARTVTTLVHATAMARSTVNAAVDTLHAHGLVERTATGLRVVPSRLQHVAELIGVLEEVTAQLRRYAAERARWHAWLTRFDADHSPTDPADIGPLEDYWWPPDDD